MRDDVNGYIFETKDELIQKVLLLYSDKELLNKLSQNARETVKDFTLENAFNELRKIYDEKLGL